MSMFSKADHAKSIHQTKNTNANITKFYLLKIHESRSLSLLEYKNVLFEPSSFAT